MRKKENDFDDLIYKKITEINNILVQFPLLGNLSLVNGDAGILMYFVNHFHVFQDELSLSKIDSLVNQTYETISLKKVNNFDFATGLLGCLWVYRYADNKNVVELPENLIDKSLEDELFEIFIMALRNGNYDLFYGAVGLAVYLLSCKQNKEKELAEIVQTLSSIAIKSNEGIYWEDKLFNNTNSDSSVIIGLAHGIPSIITILSLIHHKGVEKKLCEDLIVGATKFMLSKKYNKDESCLYPSKILDGTNLIPSRLSWCYGDLGVARSLWLAGKALKKDNWKNEAINIMLLVSNKTDLESTGIVDAGFCHGTCGLAHIYHKFYLETKIEKFNEMRLFWLDQTFKMAKWEDGLLGYKSYQGEKGWINDHTFLEGLTGIGLVLLGFLSKDTEDLNWDRCLLLS